MRVQELKELLQSTNILSTYTISYTSNITSILTISKNNIRHKINISNINNLEDFLKIVDSLEF